MNVILKVLFSGPIERRTDIFYPHSIHAYFVLAAKSLMLRQNYIFLRRSSIKDDSTDYKYNEINRIQTSVQS